MKICPVCNKEFKCITPQHIKTHDLSLESFKTMYPEVCIGNGFLLKERSIINASRDGIMCMFCGKLITSINNFH